MSCAELMRRSVRPRKVIGILNCPPDMVSMLGALFTTWSKATKRKAEGHELDDRTEPDHGGADAHAGKSIFTDRRVDDSVRRRNVRAIPG